MGQIDSERDSGEHLVKKAAEQFRNPLLPGTRIELFMGETQLVYAYSGGHKVGYGIWHPMGAVFRIH